MWSMPPLGGATKVDGMIENFYETRKAFDNHESGYAL